MSRDPARAEPPAKATPIEVARPAQASPSGRAADWARRHARWLVALALVAAVWPVWKVTFATKGLPPRQEVPAHVPAVKVVVAEPKSRVLSVVTHGTVTPRTESDLVAEVKGRILWVAPALEAGGFFNAGDELLRLDGREYEIAVVRARAAVKLAQSEARLAAAEAARHRELSKRGIASSADLEQFESRAAVAQASLDEARANLAQAELDLERTAVLAPFDGRVRERSVDLGQFVSPGTVLARIFAVDYAEVRLPLSTEDLSLVEVPLGIVGAGGGLDAPVTLTARLAGQELEWPARLVRTEGDIDLETRMLSVVARIEDPYARHTPGRAPLPVGLFVRAEIRGRRLDEVYVLPATALRDGSRVLLVDADGRLAFRDVEVVRRDAEELLVGSGLSAGDRIVVSPLQSPSEGMEVHPVPEQADESVAS